MTVSPKPGAPVRTRAVRTLVSALAAALALSSCPALVDSSLSDERVELVLPPCMSLPAGIPRSASIAWTVRWRDGNGNRRSATGIRDRLVVSLERGYATPVLARPDLSFLGVPADAPAPVGAMYPADATATPAGVKLALDSKGAIAALAAEAVFAAAGSRTDNARLLVSRVNWIKFRERVATLGTPGLVDHARFARAVLAGRIIASSVASRPSRVLGVTPSMDRPSPGCVLVPEWPAGARVYWGETTTSPVFLPDGLSRFLSDEGWLTVSVDDGEVICAFYERFGLRE